MDHLSTNTSRVVAKKAEIDYNKLVSTIFFFELMENHCIMYSHLTNKGMSVSFLSIVKAAAVATQAAKAAKATPEAAPEAAKTAAVTRLNNDKLAIHNG